MNVLAVDNLKWDIMTKRHRNGQRVFSILGLTHKSIFPLWGYANLIINTGHLKMYQVKCQATKLLYIYCMARRICAIVLDEQLRKLRLEELKKYLLQQKYPLQLIQDGINRACELTIAELRTPKEQRNEDEIIPVVTTHDPSMPNMFNMIKSNLPILHQSSNMKILAKTESIINSKRQPKNLKRHLTSAKFDMLKKTPLVSVCGDSRCGVCSREHFNYLEVGSKNYMY